ncbi:MAG TPA: ATP-binding protein [Phenylobacterium sp.]|nr:ATP-binding protein [Phenylobacterium sp.]
MIAPKSQSRAAEGQGGQTARAPESGLRRWIGESQKSTIAARTDEAAAIVQEVAPVKLVLTSVTGFAMAMFLPAAVCAGWAAVALVLEAWGWSAARPPRPGQPAPWRARRNFVANILAINGWWLVLAALTWSSGGDQAHVVAMIMTMTLCAICLLMFYNAAWVYMVAGAAPAAGALAVVSHADGHDWRQMAPTWIILGLSVVFCTGRAFKTPSAQQSQRRINESLRNFEILAENVTDVITRSDMNGVLQYISPGCLAMLGYRPDELIGTDQRDHHHPDNGPIVTAAFAKLAADPSSSVVVEVRVRHKDGSWVWIQSNAKLVCEDGVPVGLIEVSRDVTKQVAAEAALVEAKAEAESANRAKAEFLANVSHEIRTPMNGVLGALHLMDREPISPEGRELIRHANDCGRMLSQLLNDVLDFSKIEAGQLEMASEPMQVGEALDAVITLVGGQARAKGVDLRCEVEGGDLWIEGDPVRLRQAMFNLLGNAVKFTASGHVTARLTVTADVDGDRHVSLEVEDTGIGMSAEAQDHLFERFRQAEGNTARRFGGTGLGLSITQALTRMMGGEITFSSVEGEGSTFRMTFEAPAARAITLEPVEDSLLEGVNILLVEDNATNRLVARTMLTRLGAKVDEAEDGLAGLKAARCGAHDLILMDVQMPHMDGIEATRAIRGLAGPVSQVPIIALTANVMVHQRADYLAAGMNGVVAKPISPGALLSEIAQVVAQGEAANAADGRAA